MLRNNLAYSLSSPPVIVVRVDDVQDVSVLEWHRSVGNADIASGIVVEQGSEMAQPIYLYIGGRFGVLKTLARKC